MKRSARRGALLPAGRIGFVLFPFACQAGADGRADQQERREPDEHELRRVEGRRGDGRFGIRQIPAEVCAVEQQKGGEARRGDRAQRDAQPKKRPPAALFFAGKLQVDRFQLFSERFQVIRLFFGDVFAEQGADRRFQFLRQPDQQISVRNGQPRFP